MADLTATIFTLIAGAAGGAVITQIVTAFREHRQAKKEAAFSALYLAIALEDYASTCSGLISDNENFISSDGHAGQARGNVAELPEYPQTIEWKPFGIAATTEALSFRVDIDNTRAMFTDLWEFDDEDSIVPQVCEQSARLGLEALGMAIALRKSWRLKPIEYKGEWNVKTFLERKRAHYAARRERLEASGRLLDEEWSKTMKEEAPEADKNE